MKKHKKEDNSLELKLKKVKICKLENLIAIKGGDDELTWPTSKKLV